MLQKSETAFPKSKREEAAGLGLLGRSPESGDRFGGRKEQPESMRCSWVTVVRRV